MINKAAPDFCSVYVISRGKVQSIRPAARHIDCSSRIPSSISSTRFSRLESEDHASRTSSVRGGRRSDDEHLENMSRRFKNDFGDSRRRSRNMSKTINTHEDPMAPGIREHGMDITLVQMSHKSNVGSEQIDHASNSLSPVSTKI